MEWLFNKKKKHQVGGEAPMKYSNNYYFPYYIDGERLCDMFATYYDGFWDAEKVVHYKNNKGELSISAESVLQAFGFKAGCESESGDSSVIEKQFTRGSIHNAIISSLLDPEYGNKSTGVCNYISGVNSKPFDREFGLGSIILFNGVISSGRVALKHVEEIDTWKTQLRKQLEKKFLNKATRGKELKVKFKSYLTTDSQISDPDPVPKIFKATLKTEGLYLSNFSDFIGNDVRCLAVVKMIDTPDEVIEIHVLSLFS